MTQTRTNHAVSSTGMSVPSADVLAWLLSGLDRDSTSTKVNHL